MSLILEALRKSEAERRRGDTPNLHTELPPASRSRKARIPAWGWILPAILAAPIVWWGATERSSPPRASTPAADAAPGPEVTAPRPTATALPPVPRLSPPPAPVAVAPAPTAAAATRPVDLPAPAQSSPAPTTSSPRTSTPVVAPIASADGAIALSDLSIEERKALPPLKLSMLMWDDDPTRRFIILDGSRLGEGDRVGNAVITAITSDGAVLDWNGRRIRLVMH